MLENSLRNNHVGIEQSSFDVDNAREIVIYKIYLGEIRICGILVNFVYYVKEETGK